MSIVSSLEVAHPSGNMLLEALPSADMARLANALEQVQVDVGDGSSGPARTFVELWTVAMNYWKRNAGPGDYLPFVSELGPPTYGMVDLDGAEISDRWEQSLVMRQLGEEAWQTAQG